VAYSILFKFEDKKNELMERANSMRTGNPKSALMIALMIFGLSTAVSAQNKYSLEQCKTLALQNNARIKNSQLELEASKQVKKAAFTNYFPKVSATGMAFRFNDPLFKFDMPGGNLPVYDGNPANLATATQFAYFPGISLEMLDKVNVGAITAVQPIFAGGRIVTGNKLAQLGVDVNKSLLVLSENEIMLKTEEQYWLIVSLNEKMKTVDAAEELLGSIHKQANDAYQAGLINRNDVMKVSIKQSELNMNRIKLENGMKLATMAFCQNIGIPYDSTIVMTDTLSVAQIPCTVYRKADEALLNREEYKLLQQSVKAEKLQTRMKTGEFPPEVGIGAGALYYDYMDKGNYNTMVFASVKIPISDWWGASHTIKERKFKEQIAQNNYKDNSELLTLQIQKTWNELDEAYKQTEVSGQIVKQAEENLRINSDNYNSGIVNISDMLEAQMMLQQAKDQLAESRVNYKMKLVSYLQVTGRY
jgi:outer membrane protein TolC